MKNNDERILKLLEDIKLKEEKIAKYKKFEPKTNCMLILDKETININTVNKENLKLLACKLASLYQGECYLIQSGYLKLDTSYSIINGFKIQTWIEDICNKIESIEIKEEKAKLKQMKSKLENMVSDDKKVEMELDLFEIMLKNRVYK